MIVVGAAGLALDRVAELAAAGIVAGARGFGQAFGGHRIFGEFLPRQALMIAPFDAAKVHHAVHHGHFDVLPFAGAVTLLERGEQVRWRGAGRCRNRRSARR